MFIVFTFHGGANFFTSLPPFRNRKRRRKLRKERKKVRERETEQRIFLSRHKLVAIFKGKGRTKFMLGVFQTLCICLRKTLSLDLLDTS